MAKPDVIEQLLVDTYGSVTISFLPIAIQIRAHFPAVENVAPPSDLLLPVLLTEAQLLNALAVPILREGIRGTAVNIKMLKKVEALLEKLKEEQAVIHTWHDQIVAIHNDKTVEKDYTHLIEQLRTAAQHLIKFQKKILETRVKIKQMLLAQHYMTISHDREWMQYEEKFVDALLKEMSKKNIQVDAELEKNIIKKRATLDELLTKFKLRNIPIPEELSNA